MGWENQAPAPGVSVTVGGSVGAAVFWPGWGRASGAGCGGCLFLRAEVVIKGSLNEERTP